jgi:hypothetical protein
MIQFFETKVSTYYCLFSIFIPNRTLAKVFAFSGSKNFTPTRHPNLFDLVTNRRIIDDFFGLGRKTGCIFRCLHFCDNLKRLTLVESTLERTFKFLTLQKTSENVLNN